MRSRPETRASTGDRRKLPPLLGFRPIAWERTSQARRDKDRLGQSEMGRDRPRKAALNAAESSPALNEQKKRSPTAR